MPLRLNFGHEKRMLGSYPKCCVDRAVVIHQSCCPASNGLRSKHTGGLALTSAVLPLDSTRVFIFWTTVQGAAWVLGADCCAVVST